VPALAKERGLKRVGCCVLLFCLRRQAGTFTGKQEAPWRVGGGGMSAALDGKEKGTNESKARGLDVSCLLALGVPADRGARANPPNQSTPQLHVFLLFLFSYQEEVSFFVSVCMWFSQAGLILTPRTQRREVKSTQPALTLSPSLPPSSNLTTTMSHLSFPSAPHTNENNYHSLTDSASLPFFVYKSARSNPFPS